MPRGRPKQYTDDELYIRKLEQQRKAGAKWRAKNDRSAYQTEYDKQRSTANRVYRSCKTRAKQLNTPFTIQQSDIIVPDLCPICATKMQHSDVKGGSQISPTLDKIQPELGYVKGNIAVICKLCNSTKGSGSAELHRKIADYIDAHVNSSPSA